MGRKRNTPGLGHTDLARVGHTRVGWIQPRHRVSLSWDTASATTNGSTGCCASRSPCTSSSEGPSNVHVRTTDSDSAVEHQGEVVDDLAGCLADVDEHTAEAPLREPFASRSTATRHRKTASLSALDVCSHQGHQWDSGGRLTPRIPPFPGHKAGEKGFSSRSIGYEERSSPHTNILWLPRAWRASAETTSRASSSPPRTQNGRCFLPSAPPLLELGRGRLGIRSPKIFPQKTERRNSPHSQSTEGSNGPGQRGTGEAPRVPRQSTAPELTARERALLLQRWHGAHGAHPASLQQLNKSNSPSKSAAERVPLPAPTSTRVGRGPQLPRKMPFPITDGALGAALAMEGPDQSQSNDGAALGDRIPRKRSLVRTGSISPRLLHSLCARWNSSTVGVFEQATPGQIPELCTEPPLRAALRSWGSLEIDDDCMIVQLQEKSACLQNDAGGAHCHGPDTNSHTFISLEDSMEQSRKTQAECHDTYQKKEFQRSSSTSSLPSELGACPEECSASEGRMPKGVLRRSGSGRALGKSVTFNSKVLVLEVDLSRTS